MRIIRRAKAEEAKAIEKLYRAARDFYRAMGYDPDAKTGFIKYRRYFSQ